MADDPRLRLANRGRKALGKPPFAPPRFEDQVTVVAKESDDPDTSLPYPENLKEIFLGSATKRPTGTYVPETFAQPKVDPRIQPVWDKVMARYPSAASFVNEVMVEPEFTGTAHRAEFDNDRFGADPRHKVIRFRDDAINEEELVHELTHGAMDAAFPDPEDSQRHYYGDVPWDYWNRRGERVARRVSWDDQDAQEAALKKALGGQ